MGGKRKYWISEMTGQELTQLQAKVVVTKEEYTNLLVAARMLKTTLPELLNFTLESALFNRHSGQRKED